MGINTLTMVVSSTYIWTFKSLWTANDFDISNIKIRQVFHIIKSILHIKSKKSPTCQRRNELIPKTVPSPLKKPYDFWWIWPSWKCNNQSVRWNCHTHMIHEIEEEVKIYCFRYYSAWYCNIFINEEYPLWSMYYHNGRL